MQVEISTSDHGAYNCELHQPQFIFTPLMHVHDDMCACVCVSVYSTALTTTHQVLTLTNIDFPPTMYLPSEILLTLYFEEQLHFPTTFLT